MIMYDSIDVLTLSLICLQRLHIFFVPLTTAFYNVVALLGVFPALDSAEKRPYHHLR